MFECRIQFGSEVTGVVVRPGVLAEVGSLLEAVAADRPARRVLAVTDERVGDLYEETVRGALDASGFEWITHRIPPGETSKSLEALGRVYQALATSHLDRDDVVLALGGGVVSDLAGLAAATWMRGIRFVICPTTLEADIDASVGGKTAINVPGAKNLVGAFHQPILVAIDPTCLRTLDERDVRAGLAESIKHALIASEDFLTWHEAQAGQVLALDAAIMSELIIRNVRIKAAIVEQDPQERVGKRAMLNFGHTIGHAIEACGAYALRHGECVSLGMVSACRLSRRMGLLDESTLARAEALLNRVGLPTKLSEPIETERILEAMRSDKKVRAGAGHFVLLEGVARPVIRADVPESLIRDAYESLLA
jgi:3-dehydroquinate synthase